MVWPFGRKKKKAEPRPGIVMTDDQFAELVRLDDFSLEEKVEQRVEERLRQQRILAQRMSQIKETYQKLLVAVTPEEGSIILGFPPEAYLINYDEYWIYYQERPPSWLDSVWWSLARFFGKRPPHKVLKANKKIVQFNNETITVYCKTIEEIVGTGQQEAIPMVVHPAISRGWEAYEAVKAERDKYRQKYFDLLHEAKREVELALQINPRVKVYWKEKEQQGKKQEERFGGTEMAFEENPVKRELKSVLGEG